MKKSLTDFENPWKILLFERKNLIYISVIELPTLNSRYSGKEGDETGNVKITGYERGNLIYIYIYIYMCMISVFKLSW